MRLAVLSLLIAITLAPAAFAQPEPGPLGLTAEQIENAELVDAQGHELGEVENLMLGPNGEAVGLIVDIDHRRVQIPLSGLRAVPDPTDPGAFNIETRQTREQLLALPEAR